MNNQAIIVKINKIEAHPNADRLNLAKLFGTQVIVSKDVKEGDKLVYVDSNMRLLPDFLHNNNLYRHAEMNADKTKTGFFDDNGRVKCIKMRGEYSDGFLFPFEYLTYLGTEKGILLGKEFDSVCGTKFCEKYIVPSKTPGSGGGRERQAKKVPMFTEHFDTSQFMRNQHRIPDGTVCYIEEKIHGTSHRTGHVVVDMMDTKNWFQKACMRIAGIGSVGEWMYLNGTRRVVHTPKKDIQSYHDNTMREEVLEQVRGLMHKGEQIYLELYGYEKTGGQIQKNYPYGCEPGKYRATMYRLSMNTEEGVVTDLNREVVYSRAEELGFEKPHLFEKYYYDGSEESMEELEKRVIAHSQGQSNIGKGAEDTLKEGVVIWFINEKGRWEALKYKSDAFRAGESSLKDKGIVDQEDTN